jgi:lipopolysaccharide transport system permease protein
LFYPLKNSELIILFTQSKLKEESHRHYLGYLWWLFDPLMSIVIFYIIFKLFMHHPEKDYIPFLFLGLICWKWFENTITKSSGSILGGWKIFSKVNVHKSLFPTVETLYHSWKFLIIMIATLVLFFCFGFGHSLYIFMLPLILFVEFILILGISYLTSALLPFFPDLKFFVSYSLRFLFYLSGILFDSNAIPSQYQIIMQLNCFSGIIQSIRNVVMYDIQPNWGSLLYALILGSLFLVLGYYIIDKNDKRYPALCV